MTDPDADLIGSAAIGAHLGCSAEHVCWMIRRGLIPAERRGGRWVTSRAVLAAQADDLLVGAPAIAAFLGRTPKGVCWMIANGRVPAIRRKAGWTASRRELERLFPTRARPEGDGPDVLRGRKAVAAFLGMSIEAVHYHVREGSIPSQGQGRDLMASRAELARLFPDRISGRRFQAPTLPPRESGAEMTPTTTHRQRSSIVARVWKRPRKTPDGKTAYTWCVNYVEADGQRRQEACKNKREAEARRHAIEVELRAGTHIAVDGSATVLAVSDLFLKHMEQRVRAGEVGRSHLKNVRSKVDRYIAAQVGGYTFARLTFLQVETWQRELVEAGVTPATARVALQVLKRMEAFAVKRRLAAAKVVDDVCRETRAPARRKGRTFDLDDARRVLDTASRRRPGQTLRGALLCECFVNIAAVCGLRFGEICALTPDRIDFARGVILVRANLTALDEVKGPKTAAGVRDVPMPPQVSGLIRRFLDTFYQRNARKLIFTPEARPGEPVHGMKGAAFHIGHWRPLLRAAGLYDPANRFHFHKLRHFASSLMIEHGLSLPDVARMLGHRKFDTTLQIYAHSIVAPAQHHAVVAGMEASLRNIGSDVAECAS